MSQTRGQLYISVPYPGSPYFLPDCPLLALQLPWDCPPNTELAYMLLVQALFSRELGL